MKYMLLTYLDEQAWAALSDAEQQKAMEQGEPVVRDLRSKAQFLGGGPLHPTSTATTVRARGGKSLVTDGPYAETREQLGGYTLIDVRDLDEAIGIAERFLGTSSLCTIEIRAVVEPDWCPPTVPRAAANETPLTRVQVRAADRELSSQRRRR